MGIGDVLSPELERFATQIVDAAFKVHSTLGPGLLESVYETCMVHELTRRGIRVRRQVEMPIVYDEVRLASGLRIDLLVEECVIVELKAVEKVNELFMAQLVTYLKLTGNRLVFLIKFNTKLIKDGIKRVIL